jgi:hypothetical protein
MRKGDTDESSRGPGGLVRSAIIRPMSLTRSCSGPGTLSLAFRTCIGLIARSKPRSIQPVLAAAVEADSRSIGTIRDGPRVGRIASNDYQFSCSRCCLLAEELV